MSQKTTSSLREIETERHSASQKSVFGRFCWKFQPFGSPRKDENPRSIDNQLENVQLTERSGELVGVFRYFDENGDGKISPAELRNCLRLIGEDVSQEMVESVVGSSDSDGDGLLGFDDFVRMMEIGGEEERGRELREAFEIYKQKGSGGITPKSLRRMLKRLGESKTLEECTAMIRRYDINGDGVISFDEFRLMMH